MKATKKATTKSSTHKKSSGGVKLDSKKQLFFRTEKQVNGSCDQMVTLLAQIAELQIRLKLAAKRNQAHFVKHLELKLQVLQGVYNMYYEFTNQKVELLIKLEN